MSEWNIRENPESAFDSLWSELRKLEQAYNPSDEDVNFQGLANVDSKLFSRLLELALTGLELQKVHLPVAYEFWYGLCELTSLAAQNSKMNVKDVTVSKEIQEKLLLAMVDISEYSIREGGDVFSRNYGALFSLLYCFPEQRLRDLVRKKAVASGVQEVEEFANRAIERAEKVISESDERQNGSGNKKDH